jgi:hypothetical protein
MRNSDIDKTRGGERFFRELLAAATILKYRYKKQSLDERIMPGFFS